MNTLSLFSTFMFLVNKISIDIQFLNIGKMSKAFVVIFALLLLNVHMIPYQDQMSLANSLIVGRDDQSDLVEWTCKVCNASNKPLHAHFIHQKAVDVKCVLSVYAQFVVLAFRYTNTVLNVWQDILYPLQIADEHTCSGCKVQKAYHNMWQYIKNDVLRDLTEIKLQTKLDKLLITGISLGGGLATISFIDVDHARIFLEVRVVTFGAPRVGNPKWAQYFDNLSKNTSQRYVVAGDPIPELPRCLTLLCSYGHTGKELSCKESDNTCRQQVNPGLLSLTKHLTRDLIQPSPGHNIGSIMDHVDGYPKIYNYTVIYRN